MPFAVAIRRTFSAAHAIRLPDGTLEPLHGHNWHVTVTVARTEGGLDAIACVIDFHDLERRLGDLLEPWHNANLNDVPPFSDGVNPTVNPTAERVAETIATRLTLPAGVELRRVELTEAEGCVAIFTP